MHQSVVLLRREEFGWGVVGGGKRLIIVALCVNITRRTGDADITDRYALEMAELAVLWGKKLSLAY